MNRSQHPNIPDLSTVKDPSKNARYVLGIVFLVMGVPLLIAALAQLVLFYLAEPRDIGSLVIEFILVPVGLAFTLPGAIYVREERINRWLSRYGVEAPAQVRRVESTRTRVDNDTPLGKIHLRVSPPNGQPYNVVIKWIIGPFDHIRLAAGNVVRVKINPKRRAQVTLA